MDFVVHDGNEDQQSGGKHTQKKNNKDLPDLNIYNNTNDFVCSWGDA